MMSLILGTREVRRGNIWEHGGIIFRWILQVWFGAVTAWIVVLWTLMTVCKIRTRNRLQFIVDTTVGIACPINRFFLRLMIFSSDSYVFHRLLVTRLMNRWRFTGIILKIQIFFWIQAWHHLMHRVAGIEVSGFLGTRIHTGILRVIL